MFLRVLDYYNGILFLTTNRAGVLDEAFKSRIHYKIYYPPLTREQTIDIWRLNIERVREIEKELARVERRLPLEIDEDKLLNFAERLFDDARQNHGQGRWNGRQIRNAFQVARSLAYFKYQQQEISRRQSLGSPTPTSDDSASQPFPPMLMNAPRLSVSHFETMRDITVSFDNYLTTVHGGITDAQMQQELEARDDAYQDPLTSRTQAEYRHAHHQAAAVRNSDAPGGDDGSSTLR